MKTKVIDLSYLGKLINISLKYPLPKWNRANKVELIIEQLIPILL